MPRHREPGEVYTSTYKSTRSNGDVYVYQKKSVYDSDLKYDKIIERTLLGKIPAGSSEMVPTRPKKKSIVEPDVDTASKDLEAQRIPLTYLSIIKHIADSSNVTKQVKKGFRGNRGIQEKLLTCAWYCFANDGDTWPGIVPWSTKYIGSLPYATAISEDMCHDLFVEIGKDETAKQKIFLERAKTLENDRLLALDSTTIESFSENLKSPRKSVHKDKLIKNVYKVTFFYSMNARQPIAYAKIPGNISDISTVKQAVEQLNALDLKKKGIEVVADCGYVSDENMGMLIKNEYDFIFHIESRTDWIARLIEEHEKELESCRTILRIAPEYTGISLTVPHDLPYCRQRGSSRKDLKKGDIEMFSAQLHVLIYYSTLQRGVEDRKFRTRYTDIEDDLTSGAILEPDDCKFSEKYMIITRNEKGEVVKVIPNTAAIEKKRKYNGFLVLVTSREADLELGLEKYRKREYIEEGMKNYKGHTGGDRPRKWHEDTLDGQLLAQFLAYSMHESFETMIRYLKNTLAIPTGCLDHDRSDILRLENTLKNWLRKTSLNKILRWFEAVDYTVLRNSTGNSKATCISENTTKRDRLFLEKLGITV